MSLHRYIFASVIAIIVMCFDKNVNAETISPDTMLAARCANSSDDEKYTIEFGTEDGVSKIYVCSVDYGDSIYGGACHDSLNPIHLHIKSELNNDGFQDVITKNYMRGEDMDDIQGYMGFANCGKDVYLRFDIGFFTDIVQLKRKQTKRWPDFYVTRKCNNRDENRPKLQTRSFTITFDEKAFKYNPPNNDPELWNFCSDKELSLPFDSEEDL